MRTLATFLLAAASLFAAEPPLRQEFIFSPQPLHAHASSIVELPDGRLMTCWYFGSGERTADDVKVQAAYRKKGARQWDAPFTLDDTPGFPDTNPILMVDRKQRLWFVWTAILDNRWETALLKLRISEPGARAPAPHWQYSDNILLIPENFSAKVSPVIRRLVEPVPPGRDRDEANTAIARSADKLLNRLGWMPRIRSAAAAGPGQRVARRGQDLVRGARLRNPESRFEPGGHRPAQRSLVHGSQRHREGPPASLRVAVGRRGQNLAVAANPGRRSAGRVLLSLRDSGARWRHSRHLQPLLTRRRRQAATDHQARGVHGEMA